MKKKLKLIEGEAMEKEKSISMNVIDKAGFKPIAVKQMHFTVLCFDPLDQEETSFSFESLDAAQEFMRHIRARYPAMVMELQFFDNKKLQRFG